MHARSEEVPCGLLVGEDAAVAGAFKKREINGGKLKNKRGNKWRPGGDFSFYLGKKRGETIVGEPDRVDPN